MLEKHRRPGKDRRARRGEAIEHGARKPVFRQRQRHAAEHEGREEIAEAVAVRERDGAEIHIAIADAHRVADLLRIRGDLRGREADRARRPVVPLVSFSTGAGRELERRRLAESERGAVPDRTDASAKAAARIGAERQRDVSGPQEARKTAASSGEFPICTATTECAGGSAQPAPIPAPRRSIPINVRTTALSADSARPLHRHVAAARDHGSEHAGAAGISAGR